MKIIRFILPRIEYILFAAIFWGIASTGPILLNTDGDLPRHLLVGKLIRAAHEIHLTDIFSFRTTGYPSIPHEWLSQVILSIFYDMLGLGGVVLLTALIVTGTWAILYYDSIKRSGSLLISLLFTALGVGASLIHVLPRPHLFSYLFIALWILVLEQIKNDGFNRWWLLPVLMLAWVNLHGMFVLGIGIWIIYLTGSFLEAPSKSWLSNNKTKPMLVGGALSIIATFLSPSGIKIWEAIVSLGGNSYIKSRIPEYQSANFQIPETWPFVLILILLVVSFSRSPAKLPWRHVLLVTAFAGLGLYSSRMLPLFAIIAAPIGANAVSGWLKLEFPGSRFFTIEANLTKINLTSNGSIWILGILVAVILFFKTNIPIDFQNKGNTFDAKFFPIQAVNWLEVNPQSGHVFNEFDWGGYLLLRLWPQHQIFMDGHTHIYGEALSREYEQVITLSPGWKNIFENYQIEWVIVRTNSRVAEALEVDDWTPLYEDSTSIILAKP